MSVAGSFNVITYNSDLDLQNLSINVEIQGTQLLRLYVKVTKYRKSKFPRFGDFYKNKEICLHNYRNQVEWPTVASYIAL